MTKQTDVNFEQFSAMVLDGKVDELENLCETCDFHKDCNTANHLVLKCPKYLPNNLTEEEKFAILDKYRHG